MKKIIALLLAAVMVMCLFAGCASSGGSKVIKIGVFEPQSGDNGAGGKQEVLGIQYANSVKPTVTINGEEYKIELDIQDNQSSTDKAVSVPGLRHGLVRHGRVRRQEGLCPVDARRRLHRRPGQELCKGL